MPSSNLVNPVVQISDEWREWLEDELERLAVDELEALARLLGAELSRAGSTALMLVRRIDDTET